MRNGRLNPIPEVETLVNRANFEARQRMIANRTLTQVALQTIRPADKHKGALLAKRVSELQDVFGDFALDQNIFIPVMNSLIEASKGSDGKPVYDDLIELAVASETLSEVGNNDHGGLPDKADPIEGDSDGQDPIRARVPS